MLTLEDVQVTRGAFTLAANWSLEPGARCAVLGPSGGGKSTLLNAIAGFDPLTAGRLVIDGIDMGDTAPGDRPISVVFQETNLFPHLSVWQNTALGVNPRLSLSAQDRQAIGDVLERVGLGAMHDRKPGALSGGQRARVALARVLLRARPWLLLDEAFSALGPSLKTEMFALLDEVLAETGAGLLMVTHDPLEAARMDQIIVVDGGRAEPPVEAQGLLADPPPHLKAYLG
ncbi:MAG: ATP-binding cassette domain-containing protein [Pseudomonadota bacterium]